MGVTQPGPRKCFMPLEPSPPRPVGGVPLWTLLLSVSRQPTRRAARGRGDALEVKPGPRAVGQRSRPGLKHARVPRERIAPYALLAVPEHPAAGRVVRRPTARLSFRSAASFFELQPGSGKVQHGSLATHEAKDFPPAKIHTSAVHVWFSRTKSWSRSSFHRLRCE